MFSIHTTPEKFEPVILDLWLRKTRAAEYDYRNVIFFEKFRFFPSTLKRRADVFKLFRFGEGFRDGLVWTEGLSREIMLRV